MSERYVTRSRTSVRERVRVAECRQWMVLLVAMLPGCEASFVAVSASLFLDKRPDSSNIPWYFFGMYFQIIVKNRKKHFLLILTWWPG